MFSIYTSAFNLESSGLDWKEAIDNFAQFADQVVVCVNEDKENSFGLVFDFLKKNKYKNVYVCLSDYSFDDPLFDGKIKNNALQNCTEEFSISLDLDERLPIYTKSAWLELAEELKHSEYVAALIPSVNLCGSNYTYKDVGWKWYLHKTIGYHRGVVNFAKQDGEKIDINKSDTCELIDDNGNLVKSLQLQNDVNIINNHELPFVYHLWAVDFDQRIRQNKIWKPVWELRAGREVTNIITEREELEKIPVFCHNLPLW